MNCYACLGAANNRDNMNRRCDHLVLFFTNKYTENSNKTIFYHILHISCMSIKGDEMYKLKHTSKSSFVSDVLRTNSERAAVVRNLGGRLRRRAYLNAIRNAIKMDNEGCPTFNTIILIVKHQPHLQ